MLQVNESWIFQANFPKSQASKLGDVKYSIYNSNGSIQSSLTSSGISELGPGAYGVNLRFINSGNYSIHWEIEGTPYVANEEIRIYDYSDIIIKVPDVYVGFGK
jgi:hypothetical protein